jgi:hypothetical protein
MRLMPFPATALKNHLLLPIAAAVIVIAACGMIAQSFAGQIQSPTQTVAVAASPAPTPPGPTDWHKTIDSSQKLISALAIIVGGVWAWLKFFRGRTFRSRLELTVSGKIVMSGTTSFLKATMEMKNVGLSQVKLKGDAIYLDVFLIDAAGVRPAQHIYNAMWSEPVTFAVFQDHGWVEPAEEISDELLFQLPESEQLAGKLKLTVNSRGNSWVFFETEGTRWSATTIVDCLRPAKADESRTSERGKKS